MPREATGETTGFGRRGRVLSCDGMDLVELAGSFGTPLYVYSRASIEAAFHAYDRAFAGVPHRVCYAVKANNSGALLRILAGLGAGADIVSGLELLAALRAGFAPEDVVFSGVAKTDWELALGLDRGVGEFNAESEEEIQRISRLAGSTGRRARVTLRVNPDIDARSHPHISTGRAHDKFGVDIEQAPAVLARARGLPGVELTGLQCHIGSQIRDLAPMEEAARALAGLSRRLLADGFPLRTIDIGGGLGVDSDGRGAPTPSALAGRVLPVLDGLPLTLLLEPGRSLVAAGGTLLTRVVQVKQGRQQTFVIVDAGMNDLLRPALYDSFHRIEPVVSRGQPAVRVDVVGPVCESGDRLARDRELERVEAGDLLAIRDTGAYGYSMSSSYNMRPRPAEVLVEEAGVRLIRRRETFDDLIGLEV